MHVSSSQTDAVAGLRSALHFTTHLHELEPAINPQATCTIDRGSRVKRCLARILLISRLEARRDWHMQGARQANALVQPAGASTQPVAQQGTSPKPQGASPGVSNPLAAGGNPVTGTSPTLGASPVTGTSPATGASPVRIFLKCAP